MPLTRIVKMVFKTESIPQFKLLFESKKQSIRTFPGCEHLELWQDTHDTRIFFTYSRWADDTSLEAYRKSSFFLETWQTTKQLFEGKPEAWTLKAVS
ncbi:MAG TPA: antibiotic biosynthesis monooxygenase family protein [Flavitalea sp.]|nr:antibiotic biosynthesis monooxygenase family protein [Flavitalea sp.]